MSNDMRAGGASPPLVLGAAVLVLLVGYGAVEIGALALDKFVASAIAHAAIYAAGVWYVMRRPARGLDLLLILCIAVLLRGLAMTAPANLTTDGLRYVWDGRIQWAGFNPYLWVPADQALAHLRDAVIYPGINQKETAVTIYPPLAEMLFAVANRLSDSLRGIKIVMSLADGMTILALLAWLAADKLPRERVLIYAWHPLPIWEFCSMAHIDSAATALTVLAILAVVRQRQGLAGGLLAAAVATKYFPIVLAPALWRRGGWALPLAFVATLAALYLPYAWGAGWNVFGFLARHLDNEGYGAGYGFHIVWVLRDLGLWAPSGPAYVAGAMMMLLALAVWALLRRRAEELRPRHLVMLAAAFTLATSPHYAWYFGWLIPLLALHLSPAVLALTLLALLQNYPGNAQWATATLFYSVIFGGYVALAALELLWPCKRKLATSPTLEPLDAATP